MTTVETKPLEVGDVLESSWGYDQTNIDFYKVVRLSAASVWLVRIGQRTVSGSEGFMSERVTPDPDKVLCSHRYSGQHACGMVEDARIHGTSTDTYRTHTYEAKPTVHRLHISGYDGRVSIKVRPYAWARPYDSGSHGSYQSHYA